MKIIESSDNWFNVPAGMWCGLYIKERTAKKLQKLLYKQTQEIKKLLTSNKEDLVVSHWTLAYPPPEKEQTTIYYTVKDDYDTVEERIKLFDKADRIEHIGKVFIIEDGDPIEARKEVQKFYEEMYGEE